MTDIDPNNLPVDAMGQVQTNGLPVDHAAAAKETGKSEVDKVAAFGPKDANYYNNDCPDPIDKGVTLAVPEKKRRAKTAQKPLSRLQVVAQAGALFEHLSTSERKSALSMLKSYFEDDAVHHDVKRKAADEAAQTAEAPTII